MNNLFCNLCFKKKFVGWLLHSEMSRICFNHKRITGVGSIVVEDKLAFAFFCRELYIRKDMCIKGNYFKNIFNM